MKGRVAWVVTGLCCLLILFSHGSDPSMLADTDTIAAIRAIREVNNPWHWFIHDWPLGNHFYRPISTLAFEFDVRVWGNVAAGWGWTNAGLCAANVAALAWFVWELFQRPRWVIGAVLLFTWWTLSAPLGYWHCAALLVGLWGLWRAESNHSPDISNPKVMIVAMLITAYLQVEIGSAEHLVTRMMHWIPGRTASVMGLFALMSMAAFARSARREIRWPWAAVGFAILALGSYEQAVMLPACLLGITIYLSIVEPTLRRRWDWHLIFWALLVAYFLWKRTILPVETSAYQAQQMRSSGFSWITFSSYVFPAWPQVVQVFTLGSAGFAALYVSAFYGSILPIVLNSCCYGWGLAGRRRWEMLAGGLWSMVAFLPMAWVKNFEHYHYWPLALRSIFVTALVATWWDWAMQQSTGKTLSSRELSPQETYGRPRE